MKTMHYIPIINSSAGACLTMANWQDIGVKTVCLALEALLLKPGLSVLRALADLKQYYPWNGAILLDARLNSSNKEGLYTVRSPFDGSRFTIDKNDLTSLMVDLSPDTVLLPSDFNTDDSTRVHNPTLPVLDCQKESLEKSGNAYYLSYAWDRRFNERIIADRQDIYLIGDFEPSSWQAIAQCFKHVISDAPAKYGFVGKLYSREGMLDITHQGMVHQHVPIDEQCDCSTCKQGFTRAYLHHLFSQTPLLCYRLLILHNARFFSDALMKSQPPSFT